MLPLLILHLCLLLATLFQHKIPPSGLARLRDLVLLQAGWLFFQTGEPQSIYWTLAQIPVIYWLVRHAKAHRQMQAELEPRRQDQLEALQADFKSGLLDSEELNYKQELVRQSYETAWQLTALGQQTAGLACIHLGLMLFSGSAAWGSWLLWVNLPTLMQSKIQDFLLSDHVPHRLC